MLCKQARGRVHFAGWMGESSREQVVKKQCEPSGGKGRCGGGWLAYCVIECRGVLHTPLTEPRGFPLMGLITSQMDFVRVVCGVWGG